MRPPNRAARDELLKLLRRRAPWPASALAAALAVSVPTLHRMLAELGDDLISTGRARRTRYGLRRALRGDSGSLPLYSVDAAGRAHALGLLTPVHPEGSCLPLVAWPWPQPPESADGWWEGLPYPVLDMRPQGYLGRQLARAQHQQHRVSPSPEAWSDNDVLHMLSQLGSDCSGNLILGNPAFERWQQQKLAPPQTLSSRAVPRAYARLAEQAVAAGVAGSSAAGEFPKFPALRDKPGCLTPHVLVKFSGAQNQAAVRRWSDLLVCEHLALQALAELPDVAAATSRIVQAEGRTFLEVERFDRHGLWGRSPLLSLATLDGALLGAGSADWTVLAQRLQQGRWLAAQSVEAVRRLWWYGRLIANTDMHTGNLSFVPQADGTLRLAPAYDMLPMLHAPLPGGELPTRSFEPALPLPTERQAWDQACAAALSFWRAAAGDSRISTAFRRQCQAAGRRLQEVAARL